MVGATRSTIREKRPADPMRRAFRDAASVSTHASPPGSYWYHIGTVTGPRPGPADTDSAAMCGSARNSAGARTDEPAAARAESAADRDPVVSAPGLGEPTAWTTTPNVGPLGAAETPGLP